MARVLPPLFMSMFFCLFHGPSEQQLHSFDAMVWGMLWGKNRGDVGSKGVVSRHRVAQPQSVSGWAQSNHPFGHDQGYQSQHGEQGTK